MDFLSEFLKKSEVEYQKDFLIKTLSYISIGSTVEYFITPDSLDKFILVLRFLKTNDSPFKIVGRMTNILPSDYHYRGACISTSKIAGFSMAENVLSVECGASFSRVIKEISKEYYGGFEELYGIPGSLGGMLYSNAGAYGKSISDLLIDATVFSHERGFFTIDKEEMHFSYRDSIFKHEPLFVLSARFAPVRSDKKSISKRLNEVIECRKRTQPYSDKSLGSVFKRASGIPISRMIDELGLKGFGVGGAKISEKHAGFIVNYNDATAKDVKSLINIIKEKLFNAYGVIAEEEIEIWP